MTDRVDLAHQEVVDAEEGMKLMIVLRDIRAQSKHYLFASKQQRCLGLRFFLSASFCQKHIPKKT